MKTGLATRGLHVFLSVLLGMPPVSLGAPAPVTALSIAKEVIQSSGVTRRPLKLKDFLNENKKSLPVEFRYELERFLDVHPDFVMPQGELRTVKKGKHEELQLTFVRERQSFTAIISLRPDSLGRLVFSLKGKNIQRTITMADLRDPVEFLASVNGAGAVTDQAKKFVRFLGPAEIKKLNAKERKQYVSHLRKTLVLMEKVQKKWAQKKTTALHNPWLISTAYAAPAAGSGEWLLKNGLLKGKECLSLGSWIGTFKEDGSCEPPEEAKKTGETSCVACNPSVYGVRADNTYVCAKLESGTSAAYCQARSDEKGFQSVLARAGEADLEEEYKKLSIQLARLREVCSTPGAADLQKDECKALEKQVFELQKRNCEVLKYKKADGRCFALDETAAKMAADAAAGEAAGTAAASKAGTREDDRASAPTVSGVASYAGGPNRCDGLPSYHPICHDGSVLAVECAFGGFHETRYYCSCASRSAEIRQNTYYPVGCQAGGGYGRFDRPGRPGAPPPPPPPEPGFWGSFKSHMPQILTLAGTALVAWWMISASEKAQKAQIDQYYNIYKPVPQAPVPFPVSPPVVTPVPQQQFPGIPGQPAPPPVYQPAPGQNPKGVLRDGTRNRKPPRGK